MSKVNDLLIGQYVIVRCRDAGVHAGKLIYLKERTAVLERSRRLWYWDPADKKKYLSGVAVAGLADTSLVGAEVPLTVLTEDCEILICTAKAADSIRDYPEDIRTEE